MLLLLAYLALPSETASRIMLAQLARQCPNTGKPLARKGYAQLNGTHKENVAKPQLQLTSIWLQWRLQHSQTQVSLKAQDRAYNRIKKVFSDTQGFKNLLSFSSLTLFILQKQMDVSKSLLQRRVFIMQFAEPSRWCVLWSPIAHWP